MKIEVNVINISFSTLTKFDPKVYCISTNSLYILCITGTFLVFVFNKLCCIWIEYFSMESNSKNYSLSNNIVAEIPTTPNHWCHNVVDLITLKWTNLFVTVGLIFIAYITFKYDYVVKSRCYIYLRSIKNVLLCFLFYFHHF